MLYWDIYLSKQVDLSEVVKSFPCLFGDTPTQTPVIDAIDVGDAQPIRQRFYRVKKKYLDAEVKYLLSNGLAVPSSSS